MDTEIKKVREILGLKYHWLSGIKQEVYATFNFDSVHRKIAYLQKLTAELDDDTLQNLREDIARMRTDLEQFQVELISLTDTATQYAVLYVMGV